MLQIIFKKDLTGIVLRITFVYIKTRKIMKTELEKTIIDLWHISRTALAGMSTVPTRHDRMIYIKNTLKEQYPDLIKHFQFSKHVWFAIEDTLSNSY